VLNIQQHLPKLLPKTETKTLRFWQQIAGNSDFCCRFRQLLLPVWTGFKTIYRNKSPLTISGKVAVGVANDSRNVSGHQYIGMAHRTVIFAMARLSCNIC